MFRGFVYLRFYAPSTINKVVTSHWTIRGENVQEHGVITHDIKEIPEKSRFQTFLDWDLICISVLYISVLEILEANSGADRGLPGED
jgi:hypothetical protein